MRSCGCSIMPQNSYWQELPVDVAGARDAAPVGSASIPVSIGSRGLLHVMASISELSPAMSCAQLHAKVGGVPLLRQRFFLAPRDGLFALARRHISQNFEASVPDSICRGGLVVAYNMVAC